MSAPSATPRRPAPARPRGWATGPLVDAAFLLVMLGIAVVAAWPMYRSGAYLLMAGSAIALGLAVAVLGAWRRLSGFTVILVTAAVFLVFGVPLAVPDGLSGWDSLLPGFVDLVTSVVFGWKELITITLPVGSYQALLVPAFLLFLGGTVAGLSLAWRAKRVYFLAVPIVMVVQLFGLIFGATSDSPDIQLFGVDVVAPRESVLGIGSFLLAMAWLIWRAHFARRAALRLLRGSSGVDQSADSRGGVFRRVALALVMVLVAVGVSAAVTPAITADRSREVLRSSIDPVTELSTYLSPLTQYRKYFDNAGFNRELFTVSTDGAPVSRIRIATLSYYDGQVFRVINPATPEGDSASAFVRVPYTLETGVDSGSPATADITIADYDGPWLPIVSALTSVDFTGSQARTLADGFFYNADTAAAVVLGDPGIAAGDTYTVDAEVNEDAPTLADLDKPSGASGIDERFVPESMVEWIAEQSGVGSDAAGLAELIERLRQRGFLSHALDETDPTTGDSLSWLDETGDTFAPSRAGHSTDRIGVLFDSLLERQQATTSTNNEDLVAAVGDDEQFAVAAALLARQLGFPARVVLGFALDTGDDRATLPACQDSVCKGQNLTAWIEVQGDDGRWATVNTTPQNVNSLAPDVTEQRDPENPTEVTPENAQQEQPPEPAPNEGDTQDNDDDTNELDLTWLWQILSIAGLSLLIVLILTAPFIAVLVAKARRRKARRRTANPADRIVGGWDEYVDSAVDHGRTAPGTRTRTELASVYESPQGLALATVTDRAVFGPTSISEVESDRFWQVVEAERRSFGEGQSGWRRFRAALSLKSFTRHIRSKSRRRKR